MGEKCKITRAEHPEYSGRQVLDKRRQVGGKCSRRQVGDKRHKRIMRAENKQRQVGDKCKIMRAEHPEPTSGRNTSPETNVKSCGPRMHPLQRSKNPLQVNLFGEKSHKEAV